MAKKLVVGKNKLDDFKIIEKIANLIQKYLDKNVNMEDHHYPTAICGTCRLALCEREDGKFNRPMPEIPKF